MDFKVHSSTYFELTVVSLISLGHLVKVDFNLALFVAHNDFLVCNLFLESLYLRQILKVSEVERDSHIGSLQNS